MAIFLAAILFYMIVLPIHDWHGWVYFYDPITLAMNPILVLIMLLATGNAKAFFQSFLLLHKKDADANRLFSSLQAIKLAIASFLLGGGLFTLLDTIFILRTMTKETAKGVSVTLLTLLYGILSALLLLPVKCKLESRMEEMHGKSD